MSAHTTFSAERVWKVAYAGFALAVPSTGGRYLVQCHQAGTVALTDEEFLIFSDRSAS